MMKDLSISHRISILRFLMIFGVVIVHTPPALKVYEMDGTLWAQIVSFLQNGVFRSGVPVLTMISGFLLFGSDSDLDYVKLLKKKARTLLVPFMVFNLGHIAGQILLRMATGRWLGEDLFGQDWQGWMNSLFSLQLPPENEPLHFLRELIVLVVLSPVFGILIRKAPAAGLAAVSLFFLTNSDGYLINRADMPVEFYVGGLAAVYKWDLKSLDKFAYPSLLLFIVACASATIMNMRDITWLRLLAPLLVWAAASRLVDTSLGKWLAHLSKYSFFIYVVHAALMKLSWVAVQKAFPSLPVPLFTAVAPFAIAATCIGLYKACNVIMPSQLDWALGARGGSNKHEMQPTTALSAHAAWLDADPEAYQNRTNKA